MEKTLKIEIPEGYEVCKDTSTFEYIKFKPIKKEVNWEDIGEEIEGWYIHAGVGIVCNFRKQSPSENNKHIWATKEEAEACLALSQLCRWRDKYNEGWKPDWTDSTDKYIIEFKENRIELSFTYSYQNILSFKSVEIRDKFLNDFTSLIETAKPLL